MDRCPRCAADLAEAGIWSELRDWGRVRARGRARFAWGRWVLGWGLLGAGSALGYALRGETDPGVYALVLLWPAGGYLLGRWYWRGAEREYAAWVGRAAEGRGGSTAPTGPGAAEPGAAADRAGTSG